MRLIVAVVADGDEIAHLIVQAFNRNPDLPGQKVIGAHNPGEVAPWELKSLHPAPQTGLIGDKHVASGSIVKVYGFVQSCASVVRQVKQSDQLHDAQEVSFRGTSLEPLV